METRRGFLMNVVVVGVSSAAPGSFMMAQNPDGQQPPPRPGPEPSVNPGAQPPPGAEKKTLEDNEKDMKQKVERLYELASELKAQVDKTDSTKVLSLNLVKKAEEIEKLARDIKNRSKG
jgi:hypothetical protein